MPVSFGLEAARAGSGGGEPPSLGSATKPAARWQAPWLALRRVRSQGGWHAPWAALGHARWYALWRLARAAAHIAWGLAVVRFVFPHLDTSAREAAIGRWARGVFGALGITVQRLGDFAPRACGARMIVANHVSWLDIMAIHAVCPQARFVAMAEVQQWRGVRRLVEGAGTLYLERRRLRDLRRAVQEVRERLAAGDTVAVFPEGVVSDGHAVARFHGNFLQAAIDAAVPVQAVALRYVQALDGPRREPLTGGGAGGHGWASRSAARVSEAPLFTGEITLAQSLWRLAHAESLVLEMQVLPAVPASQPPQAGSRKALAARLQRAVEAALDDAARRCHQAPT